MPTIGIDASRLHKTHKTGTESYAYNLTRELLKLPTEAEWILYTNAELPEELLRLNPKARQVISPQNRFWTISGLAKAVKKEPADILLNFATPQPLGVKIPSITVIHGMEFELVPQNYSLYAFWHLVVSAWWTGKKSKSIVTPTEATRQDLIEMYDVPEGKVKVIHSGLPGKLPETRDEKPSATIESIIEKPYVLWIGRKEYRKNVDTLILAFNELKKEHAYEDLQLVIAGSKGHGYKWIKEALRISKHSDAVHNLEYVTETEKDLLFKKAKMFVFPSLAEGFGFPVLEAQSYQVPVVASDIPSLREVGGQGAIYVDPENIDQILKVMREILTEEHVSNQLVKKGEDNLKRFSFSRTAQEWYRHVEEVLA
jgi:glycosyltransferase involved in cell wall biosynthesis